MDFEKLEETIGEEKLKKEKKEKKEENKSPKNIGNIRTCRIKNISGQKLSLRMNKKETIRAEINQEIPVEKTFLDTEYFKNRAKYFRVIK